MLYCIAHEAAMIRALSNLQTQVLWYKQLQDIQDTFKNAANSHDLEYLNVGITCFLPHACSPSSCCIVSVQAVRLAVGAQPDASQLLGCLCHGSDEEWLQGWLLCCLLSISLYLRSRHWWHIHLPVSVQESLLCWRSLGKLKTQRHVKETDGINQPKTWRQGEGEWNLVEMSMGKLAHMLWSATDPSLACGSSSVTAGCPHQSFPNWVCWQSEGGRQVTIHLYGDEDALADLERGVFFDSYPERLPQVLHRSQLSWMPGTLPGCTAGNFPRNALFGICMLSFFPPRSEMLMCWNQNLTRGRRDSQKFLSGAIWGRRAEELLLKRLKESAWIISKVGY